MSTIYRNQLVPAVSMWNNCSSIFQRFDSVWGKSTHQGVPVYDGWLYYYRAKTWIEDKKLKRFLNSIGIEWEAFRAQEIDPEINDLRFYLKDDYEWDGSYAGDPKYHVSGRSTKETTQLVVPTKQEIADTFNATFEVGEEIEVTVMYGGFHKRYLDNHANDWVINDTGVIQSEGLNKADIKAKLEADPWYYFANSRHLVHDKDSNQFQTYNPNDLDMPYGESKNPSSRLLGTTQVSCVAEFNEDLDPNEILGVFAYMDSNAFELVEDSYQEIEGTSNSGARHDGEVAKYSYKQTFIYKGMSNDTQLLSEMESWYDSYERPRFNMPIYYRPVGEFKKDLTYGSKDTNYKRALDLLTVYLDLQTGARTRRVTNSLFYDGYLRPEPARLMRRTDFVELLASSIDVDEQVEKASFWERIAAYAIVIIAIVVGVFFPPSFMFMGSVVWSAVATGAAYASMVLAVGMYALSYFGGLSAQGLVKTIGAFATIVGYVAAFAGIMAAIQNAGRILATKTLELTAAEAASEAGVNAIRNEMLKQTLTDQVGAFLNQSLESVTNKLTEFVSMNVLDKASFIMDGLQPIVDGLKYYQDQEMEELQKELNVMEEEAEDRELETLSNQLKNPAAVWTMMEDQITSYDALNNMSDKIASNVGRDRSFSMWYSNCNSV